MHVLIIGAAGMIGARLAQSLTADPPEGLARLTLVDAVAPAPPAGMGEAATLDIADAAAVASQVAKRPDVIFHLAAVVSGEAEADFEKGYRVNFDGTRNLLEAIRTQSDYCPRLVFASSIAVYGAPFPASIPADYHRTPLTSYGSQ
jgi:nucleoside-diphosphate-sugar epimerase